MQVVFRARNLADANRARDVLVASGIPAHVADQALWETIGELSGAHAIRVWVDNRGLDHARRVVAAWKKDTGIV
jgi:Putative prokaryotic signal transducing protein